MDFSRRSLLAAAFSTLLLAAPSHAAPARADPPHVGVISVFFDDDSRARSIETQIYYPTREQGSTLSYGIYLEPIARAASYDGRGRLPLVVMSHGSGGTPFDQAWLAEALVRAGYLVAAVRHPGNAALDTDPQEMVQIWNRPEDVRVTLSGLLAHPVWGRRIDPGRIGAAGHSMGGYTVIALAGGIYDVKRARAHCASARRDPSCDAVPDFDRSKIDYGPSGRSYRDPRVRAALALVPAVGPGTTPESCARIDIPVAIVGGAKDTLVRVGPHARHFAQMIPTSEFALDARADHFSFVTDCHPLARALDVGICGKGTPEDRAAVQRDTIALALEFFGRTLRPASDARRTSAGISEGTKFVAH